MKIRDLLSCFQETNHIKIHDRHDSSTHCYNHVSDVISDYGCFTVQSWTVEDNTLEITIRSQF